MSNQFRAVSSIAFHKLLDETRVNAALVRSTVDKAYDSTDWADPEINKDSEFLQKFVRKIAQDVKDLARKQEGTLIRLRTFINNVVEGFAVSPEGIMAVCAICFFAVREMQSLLGDTGDECNDAAYSKKQSLEFLKFPPIF